MSACSMTLPPHASTSRRLLTMLAAGAALMTACGPGSPKLAVLDARVAIPPTDDQVSVYLTIRNTGDADDELISVDTSDAADAHLHKTSIDAEGRASMNSVSTVRVAAGKSVKLEPGGMHLMLMRPKTLASGDSVALTLRFRHSGVMKVDAIATDDPAAVMGR